MVLSGFVQAEEAFLFIGSETTLNDCILIRGALVDVEVFESQLRTLAVETALEPQPVVSLDVA